MSRSFVRLLARLEIACGCLLLAFSAWLLYASLPGSGDGGVFAAIELLLYSLLAIICGVALAKVAFLKVPSQLLFAGATLFIYLEFCSAYSGWYRGL